MFYILVKSKFNLKVLIVEIKLNYHNILEDVNKVNKLSWNISFGTRSVPTRAQFPPESIR